MPSLKLRLPDGIDYARDDLERRAPALLRFVESGEPLRSVGRMQGDPTGRLPRFFSMERAWVLGTAGGAALVGALGYDIGFALAFLILVYVARFMRREMLDRDEQWSPCTVRVANGVVHVVGHVSREVERVDGPSERERAVVELFAPLDDCRWRVETNEDGYETLYLDVFDERAGRKVAVRVRQNLPESDEPTFDTWRRFLDIAGVRPAPSDDGAITAAALGVVTCGLGMCVAAGMDWPMLFGWSFLAFFYLPNALVHLNAAWRHPDWAFDGRRRLVGPGNGVTQLLKDAAIPSILGSVLSEGDLTVLATVVAFLAFNVVLGALLGLHVQTARRRVEGAAANDCPRRDTSQEAA